LLSCRWAFGQALAQAAPLRSEFQSRLGQAALALENEPDLKAVLPRRRGALSEFIVGNMILVLTRELGYFALSEMNIPAKREEDVVDAFATLAALNTEAQFSHRVLVEAAKGLGS